MKTTSRLAVTGVVVAIVVAAVAGSSQLEPDAPATDDGFVIDDFHRAVEVQPDGRLEVVESIDVTFREPRHGIFRDLETSGPAEPVTYEVYGVDQGSDDQPWNWTLEELDESLRVRIGDPDVELDPGPQHYRLAYGMEGLLFRPQDRPDMVQVRIDVPGDRWPTSIASTTLAVELPAEPTRVRCVQGARGEVDACPDAQVDGTRVEQSVPALAARQTATVAIEVPAAAFTAELPVAEVVELTTSGAEEEEPEPPLPAVPAALLLLVLVAVPALVLELLRARFVYRDRVTDPALHDRVAPTAELAPPDNARPVELAALLQRSSDDEAVLATLLDLELRGVVQTHTTGLGEEDQRITVTPAPAGQPLRGEPPRPWEAAFLDELFGSEGRIEFDGTYDADTTKRTTAASKQLSGHGRWLLSEDSPLTHTAAGWLRGGAFAAWVVLCLVLGAAIGVIGTIVLDLSPFVPFVIWSCLAVSWLVLSLIWRSQRLPLTSEGRDVIARTRAFRTFLEQVHADRLDFAAGSKTYDQRHPALALLPYAMALGLADSWYQRFEPLLTELAQQGAVPSAGASPWWAYGAAYGAVRTSYAGTTTSPASSGSGSFGGGGAGSGGGGGGGGSW